MWSKVTNLLSGECFENTSYNITGEQDADEEEDEQDTDEQGNDEDASQKKPSKNVDPAEALKHLRRLEEILEDFEYDGYGWNTVVNEPGKPESVLINGEEIRNNFYSDLDIVNEVFRGQFGLKKMQKLEENEKHLRIIKDFRHYQQHADVRSHQIVFRRCDINECTECKEFRNWKGYKKDFYRKLGLPPSSSGGLFFTQVGIFGKL